MMRETMAEKKVNEATTALVKSFQETNQVIIKSIIAVSFVSIFTIKGSDIYGSPDPAHMPHLEADSMLPCGR
jgi:hypothetical protein